MLITAINLSEIFFERLLVSSDENIIKRDGSVIKYCTNSFRFGKAAAISDNTGTNATPAEREIDNKDIASILSELSVI